MSVYCSIDFGTTSIKLGLFSEDGEILALKKAPTPASSENGYDPDTVFSIVRNQLDVFDKAFHIDAIAITGMSEAGILLEKDTGEALSGIIPWFDGRTKEISSAYADKDYEGFCITGLHNSFKYGAYKLLWTLGNTVHGEDVIWLSACDWLFFRLTGIYATEPSFAARTYLFDIGDGRWSAERLSLFNIKEGMLPRLVCSGLFSGNTKLNGRDVPVAMHYYRDTADVRVFGLAYRERVDVVPAPGEEGHNAHEHSRFVVHQDCKGETVFPAVFHIQLLLKKNLSPWYFDLPRALYRHQKNSETVVQRFRIMTDRRMEITELENMYLPPP